jgi:hypothetical protein
MHPDDIWQDGYDTGYDEGVKDCKKEMEEKGEVSKKDEFANVG